jgi:hypothetical protein
MWKKEKTFVKSKGPTKRYIKPMILSLLLRLPSHSDFHTVWSPNRVISLMMCKLILVHIHRPLLWTRGQKADYHRKLL